MANPVYYGGNDDGQILGINTSDKISFYGATPVTRPTMTASAVATTVAVSSTNNWGFSGSTQANAIVSLVNELRADLVTLGLITT